MKLAARVLGIPESYTEAEFLLLHNRSWSPAAPLARPRALDRDAAQAKQRVDAKIMLQNLVREALAGAFQGHGDVSYVRAAARLQLAGLDVGQNYHTSKFAVVNETLAMEVMRDTVVSSLKSALPGIGIGSDFSVF